MLTKVQPTQLLLAKRELQLTRRLIELRSENELRFYEPHPKQKQFHDAAGFHYRYARTGNRFGKSEMGAAEDIAFALGYRPWIPEGDPLRTLGIPQHPTKGLVISADWDKSQEVFTERESDGPNLGKLFKYIPKNCLGQPTKNHSGKIDRIPVKHVSGGWSVIHLDTVVSYKQNPLGQESGSWDWVHVDEPIPEGMWKAVVRGFTDRGGRAWFTCTPLTEPWIDQAFVPDLEMQSKEHVGVIINNSDSRWMMTGSMDDNPHLTPEDIQRTLSWYTIEEQATRRSGIPAAYSGIVYKEFQWQDHVQTEPPFGWKDWYHPPDNFTKRLAIDYHPRKNQHVLFTATSPDEYQFVYAEIWLDCLMSELVAEIKLILGLERPTVPGLIDPLASTPNKVNDITPMQEIIRLGLPVIPATKDPHNGILRVKSLLKARDRKGNTIVKVNAACRRFLMEISRGFIWDGETNKPVKKNDDAMENFYRLCLQGLSYIEPASPNDYIPIKPFDVDNVIIRPDEFNTDPFEETQVRERRLRHASRYRR